MAVDQSGIDYSYVTLPVLIRIYRNSPNSIDKKNVLDHIHGLEQYYIKKGDTDRARVVKSWLNQEAYRIYNPSRTSSISDSIQATKKKTSG